MKKIISLLLVAVLCMASFSGCSSKTNDANVKVNDDTNNNGATEKNNTSKKSEKIKVVTTIFPEYDWVKEITKGCENVEITLLLDKGVDLHSFQPTVEDIMKLSACDVLVYVGGESDEWIEDALEEKTNKDMVVINLLDVLGDSIKEEELVEGMQGEEEEEESEEDEEDEEEIEYDEHVWLSLRSAKTICKAIEDAFAKIDASNKSTYETNCNEYVKKLDELDAEYKNAVESAAVKTLVFGDRFPFRYMVDDYDITYFAAFVGCSAESEASFETILFLANKYDELGLKSIMQIESSNGKISETILENTKNKDGKVLTLDSMQSTTSKDIKNGTTYLTVMKKNLDVLKEALQ